MCRIAAILFLLSLHGTGCYSVQTRTLANFDLAMDKDVAERSASPKVFDGTRVNWNALPEMTPYAVIKASGDRDDGFLIGEIVSEADKFRPDVIQIVIAHKLPEWPAVSYLGLPVTQPEVSYESVVFGGCFRINKSKLGVVVDEQGVILEIDNERKRSGIGLHEGDRITKIGKRRFLSGKRSFESPHHEYLLRNPPGTELEIEWIRPGVGLKKAVLKTLENPPTHLEHPDSFD